MRGADSATLFVLLRRDAEPPLSLAGLTNN
uniref:Uncharacterized protein n=1 Tax=Siphoviridae sp. ctZF426 TaxID=2827580 RepID=A0A8S5RT02_9CAUD|nr:MAG TPA: hypothetical protein [Siphoviridae sp. ctZF426]